MLVSREWPRYDKISPNTVIGNARFKWDNCFKTCWNSEGFVRLIWPTYGSQPDSLAQVNPLIKPSPLSPVSTNFPDLHTHADLSRIRTLSRDASLSQDLLSIFQRFVLIWVFWLFLLPLLLPICDFDHLVF